MLKVAMVCCVPPLRSATRTGCRIALIPTWSMASLRLSSELWTSGMASGSRMFMGKSLSSWAQCWTILTCVPFPAFQDSLRCAGLRAGELTQARAGRGDDAYPVQADGSEQLRLVAVVDVAVGKPQLKERRADRARGERFGHGASRAARDRVFFDGHDELVGPRQLCREIRIQGLHEAHVGDGRVELLAGLERGLQQVAEREQGDTFSAPSHYPLAKRQRTHLLAYSGARAAAARIAHGRRLIEGESRIEHLAALVLVARGHHHHIGHAAQIGEVERAVMRGPVPAREARAVEREHDRQLLDADVVDQLVVAALQKSRVDRE